MAVRYDYNSFPRVEVGVETFTESGTLSTTVKVSILKTYNHNDIAIFSLPRPDILSGGVKKIVMLSDQYAIARVNMERGSFILNVDYPSVKLIWNANIEAWEKDGEGPPFFVSRQQGTKLIGTGFSGDSQQGTKTCISADGNTIAICGRFDDGAGTDIGATWIFTRSGTIWTQQGTKLIGTGFCGDSQQGNASLSSDGNTLVVGATFDDNLVAGDQIGATWVFTRTGTIWTQQGLKLVGTGFSGNDCRQGESVEISSDGNTIASGGIADTIFVGATWVFTRSGTVWTQQGTKLVGAGFTATTFLKSLQGRCLEFSADANTLLIGGIGDDGLGTDVGATWVFTRSNGVWTQQGEKLVGTGFTGGCQQGLGMAISSDGNMFVVGGRLDNSSVGAIWTFTRSGTVWTQQGEKLIGTGFSGNSQFGTSVSFSSDGKTMAVSGDLDSGLGANVGAAWVFTRNKANTEWIQQGTKLIGTGFTGDSQQRSGFGKSLSADGATFVIGGRDDDGLGTNVGATWVFI